ncbi:MAG: L-threonylcarbamoyladenylate synthase [Thermaerobacter sp.]|nr:L-threonylcarbamoyladenylate synthase [Thermaerobacter sp.]
MTTTILSAASLAPAIEALRKGQVVAFPTETVYGLGADGLNGAACRKIFDAKGRPQDNPLILHVLDRAGLLDLISTPLASWTAALIEAFWPGPLTVVVQAAKSIPDVVRAGLDTVAVRAPSHPVARQLIAGVGSPIAAPSANVSGRPSPTTAEAVYEDMNGRIPFIIDGGGTRLGLESTVVDCIREPVTVLRPGAISVEMLASVVGEVRTAKPDGPARAPGMRYRHYAPEAPLLWIQSTDPGAVLPILNALRLEYPRLGLIAPDPFPVKEGSLFQSLGPDEVTAANRLFSSIRILDHLEPNAIVILWNSETGLGLAITNRIGKAATRRIVP